ncbi:type VI secretion system baseplate subunit TssF [Rubrivivax sp. JA1029]|uniref:type VI secretion system baseplate subunit TssF n=1 Tax=Rubrivivax sp. JA1029 TaxID=2894193 RepID=UPI001E55193B|nr:type VI secretion system baseplate subunit TssF [Rubrivivax sp. JA1029]MCC9645938.1 type VI secretion system baseplate subunit TssF [Rubrivivax sp. JA1029]
MHTLLPHYERELAWFDEAAREFSRRYPRVAGRLATGADLAEDPHVERLIQSFALLAARLHQRLDEEAPRLAQALLELVHPLALRPFPSCSIVRFGAARSLSQLSTAHRIPRGTLLHGQPVQGVPCRFTTTQDVWLAPVQVAGLRRQPGDVGLAPGMSAAAACLSLRLELVSPAARWATLGLPALRLHLDAAPSQVVALREALLDHLAGVSLALDDGSPRPVPDAAPQAVGFADDEALLDDVAPARAAERLLGEYFAFPAKFDFIDLPLPAALRGSEARSATLHYRLAARPGRSGAAWDELDGLGAGQLLAGCTPVVNPFRQRAEPIRVTHEREAYPVVVDARRPAAYEVHRVERVRRTRAGERDTVHEELAPLYSLRHASATPPGSSGACFWAVRRDLLRAAVSPGHELELTLVDTALDPARPGQDTLSLDVLAGNRDLPARMSIARPDGELQADGGSPADEIVLLRRPTPGSRPTPAGDAAWRLVSLLALARTPADDTGLEGLHEWLALHDPGGGAAARGVVAGLRRLEQQPATTWWPGPPAPCLLRGREIRLGIDESAFVGTGVGLFGRLLSQALALRAPVNSTTRLQLVSVADGTTLFDGGCRGGRSALA